MKKISIIIPVWNNFLFTRQCINDLMKLNEDFELIIVDNGSIDSTKKLKSSNDGKLKIIRNKENLGFGKACNIGFSKSCGEHVMFLNNDIRIHSNKEDWINKIIEKSEEGYLVGPTMGVLNDKFDFLFEANRDVSKSYKNVYISGWNITARRDRWNQLTFDEEIGPFCTKFFAYFEDTDLSFRAINLGIRLFLVDNIPVSHLGRMTGKKLNLSKVFLESKEIFLNKWAK